MGERSGKMAGAPVRMNKMQAHEYFHFSILGVGIQWTPAASAL
jgi:hypothetical protein